METILTKQNDGLPAALIEQYVDELDEIRNYLTKSISTRLEQQGPNAHDTNILSYLKGLNITQLKATPDNKQLPLILLCLHKIMSHESRHLIRESMRISAMALQAQVNHLS